MSRSSSSNAGYGRLQVLGRCPGLPDPHPPISSTAAVARASCPLRNASSAPESAADSAVATAISTRPMLSSPSPASMESEAVQGGCHAIERIVHALVCPGSRCRVPLLGGGPGPEFGVGISLGIARSCVREMEAPLSILHPPGVQGQFMLPGRFAADSTRYPNPARRQTAKSLGVPGPWFREPGNQQLRGQSVLHNFLQWHLSA